MGILCIGVLAGCKGYGSEPRSISHPDPAIKIPEMVQAAGTQDRSAVDELIRELESDDSAVRLYAIEALQRLTGETFDYRYYDDQEQRKPAVLRWQQWLDAQRQDAASK